MIGQKADIGYNELKPAVKTQINKGDSVVSHTQISMWDACPLKWYLTYVKKLKQPPSIHLVYGNAMHETIQTWLKCVYHDSVKKSNELDLNTLLLEGMKDSYQQNLERWDGKHFSTAQQMSQYYQFGVDTLKWLVRKRTQYYSTKNVKLVGIEVPILMPVTPQLPNVKFTGYIDVVLYDKRDKTYTLIDLKTSTRGWSKYQKQDKTKVAQLLLYKHYFCQQYAIDIDKVSVEFHILRNQIDEDSLYPIPRVQIFKPAQKTVSINKALKLIHDMVHACFDSDGRKQDQSLFNAVSGNNKFNCNFCAFNKQHELCPPKNRQ